MSYQQVSSNAMVNLHVNVFTKTEILSDREEATLWFCSHVPALCVGLMPVFIKMTLTSASVKHSTPAKCPRFVMPAWSASWSGWQTWGFLVSISSTPFCTLTVFLRQQLWCWQSFLTSTRGLLPPSPSGRPRICLLGKCGPSDFWVFLQKSSSEDIALPLTFPSPTSRRDWVELRGSSWGEKSRTQFLKSASGLCLLCDYLDTNYCFRLSYFIFFYSYAFQTLMCIRIP